MKDRIYCVPSAKGVHAFYLQTEGEDYYLFSQNFRKGVHDYYKNGVSVDRALDFSFGGHDSAIARTMEKLPSYIRYVEKEYGVRVLKQTVRRDRKNYYREERYYDDRISA